MREYDLVKARRLKVWAAGILGGVLLAGGLWTLIMMVRKEPEVDGHSLSSWTDEYRNTKSIRAQKAIREIGTNGLPVLLEKLTNGHPTLEDSIERLKEKASPKSTPFVAVNMSSPRTIGQKRALSGFEVLGENAESAIPQLITMLESQETTALAMEALGNIGARAIEPLLAVLRGTNDVVRERALQALWTVPADEEVFKVLLQIIAGPRSAVQAAAVSQLRRYPEHSALVVDLLIRELVSSEQERRPVILSALASQGAAAEPALPILRALIPNEPDRIPSAVRSTVEAIERAISQGRLRQSVNWKQPVRVNTSAVSR